MILKAILFGVLAIVAGLPPVSRCIYHFYSNYWPPASAAKIQGFAFGGLHGSAVNAGLSLGLYEYLNEHGPSQAETIAHDLQISEIGAHRLLDALTVLDILQTDWSVPPNYGLTRAARNHLVKSSPDFLGGFSLLMNDESFLSMNVLQTASRAVKTGGSILDLHGEVHDHPFWTTFAKVTAEFSIPNAETMANIAEKLGSKKNATIKVLDVAAGSGAYGLTFAKRFPNAKVTFADYETVLPHIKERAQTFDGVKESQLSYIEGSMLESDLTQYGPYDIVLVSQFYHHFSRKTCVEITKRLHSATKQGGLYIVHDMIPAEGTPKLWDNDFPYIFSYMMLLWTRQGQAYRLSDYQSFLAEGGFTKDILSHANFPFPSSFVSARKP